MNKQHMDYLNLLILMIFHSKLFLWALWTNSKTDIKCHWEGSCCS